MHFQKLASLLSHQLWLLAKEKLNEDHHEDEQEDKHDYAAHKGGHVLTAPHLADLSHLEGETDANDELKCRLEEEPQHSLRKSLTSEVLVQKFGSTPIP